MKRYRLAAFLCLTAAIVIFSSLMGRGAAEEKVAYVTFDDGPTLNTPNIIDCLERHGAGAAFFVLKDRIELYPDFIRKMEQGGFTIGLHGVSHSLDIYSEPARPLREMNQTADALYGVIGRRSSLVRTPYGSRPNMSDRQRELLEAAGYEILDWNVDPRDSIGSVVDRTTVLRNLKSGLEKAGSPAVILLHDRKSTANALDEILSLIEAEGYVLKNYPE